MFFLLALLSREVNRWQQMALRGKDKLKRSVLNERRPLLEKQGKQGRSIWQSRSQPFVTCLTLGLITTVALSAAPFYLKLQTSAGNLVAELYPDVAPQTVMQISTLVKAGLYDSTPFFRLERNFVLQTAVVQDRSLPLTSEQRALIHKIPAEFSSIKHERGVLSMARQDHDVNSGESSFSILLAEAPHLDGKYTIFGRLVEGWETLEKIESMPRNGRNQPEFRIEICKAEILE